MPSAIIAAQPLLFAVLIVQMSMAQAELWPVYTDPAVIPRAAYDVSSWYETSPRRRPQSLNLVHAAVVLGVPCAAGERVDFHPQGDLAGAVLGRPYAVAGHLLPAASAVRWHRQTDAGASGRLENVTLASATVVSGLRLPAGSQAHFSTDEVLQRVQLSEPTALHGIVWPADSELRLGADGNLQQAQFRGRIRLDGVDYRQPLRFHGINRLVFGVLDADASLAVGRIRAGSWAIWTPQGQLRGVTLFEEHQLGAKRVPANTQLCLDANGTIASRQSIARYQISRRGFDPTLALRLCRDQ